jgi:hypothetical protein
MSSLYQALSEFTVEQLRALSWHYAVAAKGTEHADTLCIDPRQFKKTDLRTFLSGTVPELVEVTMPTKAGWKKMVKTWQETSRETIAALLSAPSASTERKVRGSNRKRGAAVHPVIQRTGIIAHDEEDSNKQNEDEDDEPGATNEDVDTTAPSTSNTAPPAKKKKLSAGGGLLDTQPVNRTVILCTGCGHHYTYGEQGRFCNNCGRAWITGDGGTTSSSSTGGSSNAPPSQWPGLTTFTPRAAAAVMTSLPARSHTISTLPAQVIEKARSGQQYYTLSDLLPTRAPDASAASSSALDSNAFILRFNTAGEALTTSSADPAEIASLAKRKRQVSTFAEIVEVFFFSLISVIYAGRPDIQEQLIGLLSLANDIHCQYGHSTALAYIDVVRRRHFQSCPPRTHVLLIETNLNMATLHQDVLLDTIATIRHGSAAGSHSSAAVGRSMDQSTGPCRNFNRALPCFKTPCHFAHTCATCGRSGHGSSTCNQGGGRAGQPPQQAPGSLPSSSMGARAGRHGSSNSTPRGSGPADQSNQPGSAHG